MTEVERVYGGSWLAQARVSKMSLEFQNFGCVHSEPSRVSLAVDG